MALVLPEIRVGDPLCHESVAVFPLFSETGDGVRYRLSEEALADESVVVEEVDQQGSVPELMVENRGDARVLFLEGEQLVGAKQDRVLNTSVMVAPRSRTKIPVSCVEQGRWGYRTKSFGTSPSYMPSSIRSKLKSSVTASLRAGRSHRSDQGRVWQSVQALHAASGVHSPTGAMEDAYASHGERWKAFQERLGYVAGATGLAICVGSRLTVVDLYDKAQTCARVWERLVAGAAFDALDALDAEPAEPAVAREDVAKVLAAARQAAWEQVDAVADGEEYRAELETRHASALVCDGAVVHESVV